MKKEKIVCVYCITNKVNNKKYVGSTINYKKRKAKHLRDLNSDKHHSSHLQKSWKSHGSENFSFNILELCSEENLIEREQHWLDHYQSYHRSKGYNLSTTAYKITLTEEGRKKKSESMIGKNKGKIHTEETRKKNSDARIGIPHTIEHKKNISTGVLKYYETVPKDVIRRRLEGIRLKEHTQASKEHMSIIKKDGRLLDPITRKYVKPENIERYSELVNLKKDKPRVYKETYMSKGFQSTGVMKRYTKEEDEKILRFDKTIVQLSLDLNRSISSIYKRRDRLRLTDQYNQKEAQCQL